MPGIGHNPFMRIVVNGAFCLRAGILAVLCTLAFAASAYADAASPGTEPEAKPVPSGQEAAGTPAGGSTGSVAEATPPEGATGGPAPEPNPESAGTGQGGGGSPGGTGSVGGGEHPETPPPAKETPPPAKEAPPPVQEPPPAVTGEGAPPTSGPGVETTPVVTEPAKEVTTGIVVIKAAEEEAPAPGSHAVVSPGSGVSQAAVARAEEPGAATSGPSVAIAGGLTPPPTGPTGPTAAGLEPQASAPAPAGGNGGGTHAVTVAQRAGSLSCELSALGGRTIDNCTVGWLGGKRFLSSNVSVAPVADGLAAAASSAGLSPPGGGHGGSAVGNAPVSPGPGPAPSGASGAAVGGASSVAPSAFLSLAGLLLLAAPRALRRLRLSCRPWLTACFVLIPERPG